MTSRTSLTPAVIADNSTKRRPDDRAMAWASVVLPVPGGPQRMTEAADADDEESVVASVTNGDPGRSKCPWPATSSRLVGRMRTASGVWPWKRAEEGVTPPG